MTLSPQKVPKLQVTTSDKMYNKNMHWKMRECEKKNHIMNLLKHG